MRRFSKALCLILAVLAMTASAFSMAAAAPQQQSKANAISLDNGFSFVVYFKNTELGTWTVSSDGSWTFADPQGAPISSGTLTMVKSQRGLITRVVMSISQDFPVAANGVLTLTYMGTSNYARISGRLVYTINGHHGYVFATGVVLPDSNTLTINAIAPVMLSGAQQ